MEQDADLPRIWWRVAWTPRNQDGAWFPPATPAERRCRGADRLRRFPTSAVNAVANRPRSKLFDKTQFGYKHTTDTLVKTDGWTEFDKKKTRNGLVQITWRLENNVNIFTSGLKITDSKKSTNIALVKRHDKAYSVRSKRWRSEGIQRPENIKKGRAAVILEIHFLFRLTLYTHR